MDNNVNTSKEYYTIDVVQIFKSLWKHIWIIILSAVIAAALGFSVSSFVIKPQYSSSVMLYVNNSSINLGNTSFDISSSDITASQNLVKTYGVILDNRTTLERVIEKCEVNYTYKELSGMIESGNKNGTEIMTVKVTSHDPYEAAKIANCIAEILPVRINEIIDGASMEIVDTAIPNLQKVSPSITNYTAIGFVLGILVSAAIITVFAILDDTVHDEDYILQTYSYPILAKIPDLTDTSSSGYSYYAYKKPGAQS